MKTKILSILFIALFAISTPALAQKQTEKKRSPEQREMMMKRHKQMRERQQSFFTEEQKEAMKAMRLETVQAVKPLKNELNELNARQQTLITADKTDFNAINKNIDQISELKAEIMKIMAKQHQEVRAMLTEEQLVKFDAMKMRRGDRKGNFDGRKMHRGERQEFGRRG